MDEIVIYGSSDDLIEIEATAFPNEEFMVDIYAPNILAVSDGTVLRVRYDEDGVWRFTPVVVGSASLDTKHGTDDRDHTDRVTLTGENLRWVVHGIDIAR